MDINQVLTALAEELSPDEGARELYICGGAALNLLGLSSRQTADIDVLAPKLDEALKVAATRVATQLGLKDGWLNNGPDDLLNYLEKDWKKRATLAFETPQLKVYSLSRQELLSSKFGQHATDSRIFPMSWQWHLQTMNSRQPGSGYFNVMQQRYGQTS